MIWLVIPKKREGERGAGQWKDLQGIRQVLNLMGVAWQEFAFDQSNGAELAERIGNAADTVIWYYSFWPEALETLSFRCPRVRLILRTVNAEALQHWLRAGKDWRRLRGLPRDVYGFARLLWRDRRCVRAADALAGISSWDDAHYWHRLGGAGKTRCAPYVCPWPALLPDVKPLPWAERKNTIACLAGTRDVIGRGHIAGLAALARRPELAGWRFVSSDGFMDASHDPLPEAVERIGRIAEPWELLCRVKAVAVLSPLGHGYKTTVTDALAAGCQVLVHPRQHARLEPDDRNRAIPVDPESADDMRRAVEKLNQPPTIDPEDEPRRQMEVAIAAWQTVLDPLQDSKQSGKAT